LIDFPKLLLDLGQAVGLAIDGPEEDVAEMIFRTKRGQLELRFDDDIADLVIAKTEATWSRSWRTGRLHKSCKLLTSNGIQKEPPQ
jgi:hypothetical protein